MTAISDFTERLRQRESGRSPFHVEDQHGTACHRAGHVDGCAGSAGGEHELMDGWIAFDDEGFVVEVEVS